MTVNLISAMVTYLTETSERLACAMRSEEARARVMASAPRTRYLICAQCPTVGSPTLTEL